MLEDIWRHEPDPVRALYQGILQIGVALHHLRRDNWRGAVKLLLAGIEKVERFVPCCMGVDTEGLLGASRRCLALLQQIGPERVHEFDWSLVPQIAVQGEVPQPLPE